MFSFTVFYPSAGDGSETLVIMVTSQNTFSAITQEMFLPIIKYHTRIWRDKTYNLKGPLHWYIVTVHYLMPLGRLWPYFTFTGYWIVTWNMVQTCIAQCLKMWQFYNTSWNINQKNINHWDLIDLCIVTKKYSRHLLVKIGVVTPQFFLEDETENPYLLQCEVKGFSKNVGISHSSQWLTSTFLFF